MADHLGTGKKGDQPSLKDLLSSDEIISHAPQWKLIGSYLGVIKSQLDIIEHDERRQCVPCFTEMLGWWIDNDSDASKTKLQTAIKKLPVGLDDFDGMESAAGDLVAMYTSTRFDERIDVRSFNLCECVMPLSLSHHEGLCKDMPKSTVDLKHCDIGMNIKYIYDLLSNGRTTRILIEGAAGIGKTVLSKEIAYFWAVNRKENKFELVFFLQLRYCDLEKMKSIDDLLRSLFLADHKIDQIKKNLESTKGENILFIIDGYDEISECARIHSFVAKIIDKCVPQLLKCAMVITCRSHVSSYFHSKIQHRIRISGFLEVKRFDYIEKALESKDATALRQYLNFNSTIRGMCYNPLILSILCYLVKNLGNEKLADTHSKLFKDVILKIIVRDLRRTCTNLTITGITEFKELPGECYSVVVELSRLAFTFLQQEKINIKTDFPQLTKGNSNNLCGFGLLNTHIGSSTEIFYVHFIHSCITEYMAAYHISLLDEDDVIKLLHSTFWKVDYFNTWIMYFGITNGRRFALRHFLSGNRYEFVTKHLTKDCSIANEFLSDKVKKLHLLQCFAETSNPVLVCNPAKEIDLSDQSVDVHAVGFFFLRSRTNCWEMLNLHNCRVGCAGLEILIEKFDTGTGITIKRTDFSYNDCYNLSDTSSRKSENRYKFYFLLFKLLTSWHTHEVVVSDTITIDGEFLNKIEQVFYESNLTTISIGSNLFTNNADQKQVLGAFSEAITSLHVMNCTCSLDASWLVNSKLSKLHIYGSKLNKAFVECDKVLKHSVMNNVFIHDHSLPNQDATRIGDVLLQIERVPPYIFVIIGDGIVKGTFCTCNLRSVLSDTEILNLIVNLKNLRGPVYLPQSQTMVWRENFRNESCFIVCNFIEILQRMNMSPKLAHELTFVLVEKKTLIVHNVKCKNILRELAIHKDLNAVYISSCELDEAEWKKIFVSISNKKNLLIFHVYNARLPCDCITEFLDRRPALLKEVFMHCVRNVLLLEKLCTCAAFVCVTNSQLIGVKPTCKQISLALQLEPNITIWILPDGQLSVDCAFQVMEMLATSAVGWEELNFSGCAVGDFECDVLHRSLRNTKNGAIVKTLNLSYNRFTTLSVFKLVDVMLMWKTEELIIDGNVLLCHRLSENIEKKLIERDWNSELFLSIVCGDKNICFCYKLDWSKIKLTDFVTNLYLIQCQVPSDNLATDLSKLMNLNRLYIIYTMISGQAVVGLVKQFMNLENSIQLSIHNKVSDEGVVSQLRRLLSKNTNLSLLIRTSNSMLAERISQEQKSILRYLCF